MDRAGPEHSSFARLLAVGAAAALVVALLGAFAGPALGGEESGVDVVVHEADTETVAPGDPPTACTFHLHFQADTAISGAFQIRAGDEDGDIVEDGEFDTTSGDSRAPASGVFELDPGPYTVTWDDEIEVDESFDQQAIEVACEAPTGSEVPIESGGSELPIESGGSELPIESGGSEVPGDSSGEELPAGGVGGITATPPATDASVPVSGQSDLRPTFALLAGIGGLAIIFARRQRREVQAQRKTIDRS